MSDKVDIKVQSAMRKLVGIEVDPVPGGSQTIQNFNEILQEDRIYLPINNPQAEDEYRMYLASIYEPTNAGVTIGNEMSRLQQRNLIFNYVNRAWVGNADFIAGIKPDWVEYHPGMGNVNQPNAMGWASIHLRNGTGNTTAQNLTSLGAQNNTFIFGFFRSLEFPIEFRVHEQWAAYQEAIMIRLGWVETPADPNAVPPVPMEVRFSNEPIAAGQVIENERFIMGDPGAWYPQAGIPGAVNFTAAQRAQFAGRNVITIDRPPEFIGGVPNFPLDKRFHFLLIKNLSNLSNNGADIYFAINAARGPGLPMPGIRVNVLFLVDTSGSVLQDADAVTRINTIMDNLSGILDDEYRYAIRIFGVTENAADAEYSNPNYIAYNGDTSFKTNTQLLLSFDDALNTGVAAGRAATVVDRIKNFLNARVGQAGEYAYSPVWRGVVEACSDFELAEAMPGAGPNDVYVFFVISDAEDTSGGLMQVNPRLDLQENDGTFFGRKRGAEIAGHIVGGVLPLPTTRSQREQINDDIASKVNDRMKEIVNGLIAAEPADGTFEKRLWKLRTRYCKAGERSRAILTNPGAMGADHPLVRLLSATPVDIAASADAAEAEVAAVLMANRWCHNQCFQRRNMAPAGRAVRR